MAPTLALRRATGLALAIGAAGGTRLRTALVGVLAAILDEGLRPAGGGRPAARPSGGRRRQRRAGRRRGRRSRGSRRRGDRCGAGPALHHYFGGVSVDRTIGAAPIRGGAARALGRATPTGSSRRTALGSPGSDGAAVGRLRVHAPHRGTQTSRARQACCDVGSRVDPPRDRPAARAGVGAARLPRRRGRSASTSSASLSNAARRAAAATARPRAAGRRGRPRSRAGTPRCAARRRRSAGSSRSRPPPGGRAAEPA